MEVVNGYTLDRIRILQKALNKLSEKLSIYTPFYVPSDFQYSGDMKNRCQQHARHAIHDIMLDKRKMSLLIALKIFV